MSEVSIKTIIEAGRKSLADMNYWSALIVALTLPSMCSRIEYSDKKYQGKNKNDKNGLWYKDDGGVIKWHDKFAYIKWVEEWVSMGSRSTIGGKLVKNEYEKDRCLVSILGENYAKILYNMRCNILHEFETDIEHGSGLPIFFSIGITNTTLSDEYIVEIKPICETIFYYAENWIDICHHHDLPRRQYYDVNSRDDRLLYQRLCDKDRADHQMELHKRELDRRNGK